MQSELVPISASYLTSLASAERDWIVEGLCPHPSVLTLTGPPKTYKSLFVQSLGLAVASGKQFMGTFGVPSPKPVLLVQDENSEDEISRRMASLAVGYGIEPWNISSNYQVLTNQGFKIDKPWMVRSLEKVIEQQGTKLVIFDPLVNLHDKDEDSSSEMSAIMYEFLRLRDKYEVTVLIVHHSTKWTSGHLKPSNMRGSGVIWSAPDGGMLFTPTKSSGANVSTVLRGGGQADDFHFEPTIEPFSDHVDDYFELLDGFEVITLKVKTEGNNVNKEGQAEQKLDDVEKFNLVILNAVKKLGNPDILELKDEIGRSDRHLRPWLNRLCDSGRLTKVKAPGQGGKYQYQLP